MKSSYEKHNYAEKFTSIVLAFKPSLCVELGTLHGYSTIAMARGLKRNKELKENAGILHAFDLFEDYPFNNAKQAETQKSIDEAGVPEFIKLHKEDACRAHEHYPNNSVSLLHVDLSNTGEIVRKIMELWDPKMVVGGLILFEGGSKERDQVEWMIKYNKEPIKTELDSNEIIKAKYVYGTYLDFPSLTVLLKKR